MKTKKNSDEKLNRDPISGEPGAHPVGAGVGATGGGVAGAALGSIGGPVGAAVGAVVGGLVGGLAGKGVAEGVNPTVEDAYWRQNYIRESYVEPGMTYDDDYAPAYRLGYETYPRHREDLTAAESEMEKAWSKARGKSRLEWEKARHAARASYSRVATANADTAPIKV